MRANHQLLGLSTHSSELHISPQIASWLTLSVACLLSVCRSMLNSCALMVIIIIIIFL